MVLESTGLIRVFRSKLKFIGCSENGCKIQYSECSRSGIMYTLKIVKIDLEEINQNVAGSDGRANETKVLKELVKSLLNRGMIVVAD